MRDQDHRAPRVADLRHRLFKARAPHLTLCYTTLNPHSPLQRADTLMDALLWQLHQ